MRVLSSTRILGIIAFSWSSLAGCFALFNLDEYGPPREGAPADAGPPPADASPEVDDEDTPLAGKMVFVTSARFTGKLGGLANADAYCQSAAADAGLSGTFKAWLSGPPSGSPSTRFSSAGETGDGGRLVTPDRRKVIAPSIAALPSGLLAPIAMTELGTMLPASTVTFMTDQNGQPTCAIDGETVWTNTSPQGTRASGNDCAGWSANSGTTGMVGIILPEDAGPTNHWTMTCPQPCSLLSHLYCFEQ